MPSLTRLTATASLVLLAIAFVAINVIADRTLSGVKLDLTEGDLYTLTDASRRIARSPEEPVTLTYYFSQSALAEAPGLLATGRRVEELLEAFEAASEGKVRLRVVDPEPYSEQEERATNAGLRPINLGEDPAFMGLVGTNRLGSPPKTIPLFGQSPEDERFREATIAQVIYALSNPDKPVVGLVTSLPLEGGFDPATGRQTQPWRIRPELDSTYDVRPIDPEDTELPADLDALLLIHPKGLSDGLRYAIDQHALAGKGVVLFQDPLSVFDPAGATQRPGTPPGDASSDLAGLLAAWGASMRSGVVAADPQLAVERQAQTPRGPSVVPFVYDLALTSDHLSDADPAVGRLTALEMLAAGLLEPAGESRTRFEPLITATEQSGALPIPLLRRAADPRTLLGEIARADAPVVLAARLTGPAASAFPGGPPETAGEGPPESSGGGPPAPPEGHLDEAVEAGIRVAVVADVDMLNDPLWLGRDLLGERVVSENAALLFSLIDQMAGSQDLLALRARGRFSRPFTTIERMQRDADAELIETNRTLREREQQIARRINDILAARGADGAEDALLSGEVREELERLRAERAETRRELRENRAELNRDVEALKTRIMLINTALVPALLFVGAIGLAGYRAARRRRDTRRASRA